LRVESSSLPTQLPILNSETSRENAAGQVNPIGGQDSQLTLTFLGTGTSQGVPMIGCDCLVCHSPDPRDKRLRSSIYLETPECSFVVDTGTDFRTQALRENIRRVDAVVFTHSHTDHIMGFDDLRRFSHARGSMPVYASAETMRDLKRVFRFAFRSDNPFPYYLKPEPHVISGPFQLGSTMITPLPVPHGDTIVNGYLFSRPLELRTQPAPGQHAGSPSHLAKVAAYLSDCSAVANAVVDLIKGVKVLIIDALRHKPHPTHLSVDQALAVSAQVQPQETYFTHIAHELPQAAESEFPDHIHIAYDGLKLGL
jgi:phosphoribosyl 1,2-cyclic phosphate phosphodiesterase